MSFKAYYINLDKRQDRNKNFLKNFKLKIKTERFSAISGESIDIRSLSEDIITQQGIKDLLDKNKGVYIYMTKGAIGCAISHKLIWEKALINKFDKTIIFEDDIIIDELFEEKLNKIYKEHSSLDIVYLGCHNFQGGRYNIKKPEVTTKPRKVFGAFGYVINKKAAEELIKIFPITNQIDSEMCKAYKNLNVGIIRPYLVFSEKSDKNKLGTDIQIR
jgi:glycosyl transferase family 25